MNITIATKVGTYEIDTAKISRKNLEVMAYTKARHMLCNEVDSHMLSWAKANPKATDAESIAEQKAAIDRMIHRIMNTDLEIKASPVRLSPVESELRELLQAEANKRAKANGGGQLRGKALAGAVQWLRDNDESAVAKLRKVAEQKAAGVDKITRKASQADLANLMAAPSGKAA